MPRFNSTSGATRQETVKPYPDFPLTAHRHTGRWCKKIRGKTYYFGPLDDWQAALDKYNREKDDLYAGRTPRDPAGQLTVKELVNKFLGRKEQQADRGEITRRMFVEYTKTCARVVKVFGLARVVVDLGPEDFANLLKDMSTTLGLAARGVEIVKTRAIFNYAVEFELTDKVVRFGPDFAPPSKKTRKKAKAAATRAGVKKMFEAEELRAMIGAANPELRAMLLLAINCGFGNNDLATLPLSALDLDRGWHYHARPKTGEERRAPLWPETLEAIKAVLARRKAPKDPADTDLLFITSHGLPYVRFTNDNWKDSISATCETLLKRLKLSRPGASFYAARHTFETIGGGCKDQVAVNFLMGHTDGTMAGEYREGIEDDRLQAVVDHIHAWLFPSESGGDVGQDEADQPATDRPRLRVVG